MVSSFFGGLWRSKTGVHWWWVMGAWREGRKAAFNLLSFGCGIFSSGLCEGDLQADVLGTCDLGPSSLGTHGGGRRVVEG
jgi:hypothetical protein